MPSHAKESLQKGRAASPTPLQLALDLDIPRGIVLDMGLSEYNQPKMKRLE